MATSSQTLSVPRSPRRSRAACKSNGTAVVSGQPMRRRSRGELVTTVQAPVSTVNRANFVRMLLKSKFSEGAPWLSEFTDDALNEKMRRVLAENPGVKLPAHLAFPVPAAAPPKS